MEDNNNERLRSQDSRHPVDIRFINFSTRNVDLVWINYDGGYVKYGILRRMNFMDITTYKTHPWMAFDYETKERLLVDGNFTYYPLPWQERFPGRNCPERSRILIRITLPLHSLKVTTLFQVARFLKNADDCDTLELPTELKDDVKKIIQHRNGVHYV